MLDRLLAALVLFGLTGCACRSRPSMPRPMPGSLSIGVKLDRFVASANSAPAHARVETWIRTSRDESFLKLWASTAKELRQQIEQAQQGHR